LTIKTPQNATTIDTVSEGFAAINRRPWLLLLPLLLSVYLWFGTQLSFRPLLDDLAAWVRAAQRGEAAADTAQFDALTRMVGQQDMRQLLVLFDFVPTMTTVVFSSVAADGRPLRGPTGMDTAAMIDPQRSAVLEVSTLSGALLAFVLVNLVALPLSAVFLAELAEAVRREQPSLATMLRRSGRAALRLLGYFGVVWGLKLLVALPFLFFVLLLVVVSQELGVLAMILLLAIDSCVNLFIWFAPAAIVISGIGPLRAIRASFNIVRHNILSTIWLWIMLWFVPLGMGLIWASLVQSPVGLVVALLGSAYIGSGLLAAHMAFYRERLRRWQAAMPARWVAR